MKILITGGAGFIGHNLAIYLKNNGFNVEVIDSFERSTTFAIKRLEEADVPAIRISIIETESMRRFFKEADAVIHAAAYVDVAESMEKPLIYLENNVLGTASVVKASLETGVGLLIYLSSAAVYGDPIRLPIDENHPTNPISPYGLSKLMGEEVVRFFSKYGLKQIVLRLFNIYGPGQNAAYAGVITKFFERVRKGLPPIVYGDGEQTRDFIHVDDVAEAVKLVLESACVGEVLNIGSGNPTRIRDLATLVMRLHGVSGEPIYTNERLGDIKHSCADISKARKLLGFKPRINLEHGLKKVLEESY
ncbi:MAG: NAD-dependent epimerase/dehydratase family protein [Candidatus Brockarchaeota archaeon]|nr:NAD-dependent epimerase/dehydratase family protein [Candidatus Brockarchaeota archaeon]